jgi:hypothetical protein
VGNDGEGSPLLDFSIKFHGMSCPATFVEGLQRYDLSGERDIPDRTRLKRLNSDFVVI